MKLGKLVKKIDARTLRLARYVLGLGTAPAFCNLLVGKDVSFGPMKNDEYGDCTCAAVGHLIQCWTEEAGQQIIPTDDEILALYSAVAGFDSRNIATDQGATCLDVLNYWRSTGLAGHKLGAYAELDSHNQSEIMKSIYYLGGAYFGFALPQSAEGQEQWKVADAATAFVNPGSWGGHAVPAVAYGEKGITVVTWGKLLQVDWDFVQKYADEAYACLSSDILNAATGKSPEGFDLSQLQQDLAQVTQ